MNVNSKLETLIMIPRMTGLINISGVDWSPLSMTN